MNLLNLSSTDLRGVLRLLEQRDALLQQVAHVERQLTALENGQAALPAVTQPTLAAAPKTVPAKTRNPVPAKAGQRRKMKVEIVEMLQRAGTTGLTVAEIAQRLGVDVNRIFTWFYATGKRIKPIKKVGNAQYRWVA